MTSQNPEEHKTCFVAMPITTPNSYVDEYGDQDHFGHVLDHLFRPALEELGFTVVSPSVLGAELIHAEIIKNLEQAELVLCDLSSLNPNVFFELGIRTSLDRPLVLVKDNLTPQVPFDLNAINTFTYNASLTPWSLVGELPRLIKHVKDTVDSQVQGNAMWRYFGLTKRATPSESGTVESKLDLLIDEFTKSQLSAAALRQPATVNRPTPLVVDVTHKISRILAVDGIKTFKSVGEDEVVVSIPNRRLSAETKAALDGLAREEKISIIVESPTESMNFNGPPAVRPPVLDLSLGDVVTHDKFGLGTVVYVEGYGLTSEAKIDFGDDWGVKHLVLRYSPLAKL